VTPDISLRKVWAIRIAWPVSSAVLLSLLAGDTTALDSADGLAGLYAILADSNPLGDFGIYQAVAEITPGWELFRPAAGASPTRGIVGQREVSPSLMVTIHIPGDAPKGAVDAAIARLLAAHPWEIPVVEVSEVTLAALS
jgi:hypothetical protein